MTPKVVLKTANSSDLTSFIVRVHGQPIVKGSGEDFIKPLLDANQSFKRAEVKVVASVNKIWISGGKAGITWRAVSVAVDIPKPREITYESVFDEHTFDA
jgi:hypothetical protein